MPPKGKGVCCHDHDCEEADCGPQYSLYEHIDTGHVRCLNEAVPGSCKGVFRPWHTRGDTDHVLESNDDDPELLLHIPFNGQVTLKAICVVGGGDGASPAKMRLITNREDVDFTSAADIAPQQEFDMIEDLRGVVEYPTQLTKFKGVHHLCIHFPAALAGDRTQITFIGLKGEFQQRRREAVQAVYESQPMPEDNKAPEEYRNTMGFGT
ncbi:unnamed protein product [Pedinophyceae sp. YPF-701]|nr:unnamed protein product [Pedinophyceae sp. YPF-701]